MSKNIQGMLFMIFGVIILSPDSILIKLAAADIYAIISLRGLFTALATIIIVYVLHNKKKNNYSLKVSINYGFFFWFRISFFCFIYK